MPLRNSTLILSSKDRDTPSISPTNNFWITLNKPVFNVVKAEFRLFFMENGLYNITSENNSFAVVWTLLAAPFTTISATITIPPGYYTETALAQAIQDDANTYGTNLWTAVDANEDNTITFKSVLYKYSITINSAAVANTFGFVNTGTYASVPYSDAQIPGEQRITTPGEIQIVSYPYILLQSSKLQNQVISSRGVSAFAVVPMTTGLQPLGAGDSAIGTTYDAGSYPLDASYFNQPQTLDRVDIRVVDEDGNIVDTRGNDISIVLRIVHSV